MTTIANEEGKILGVDNLGTEDKRRYINVHNIFYHQGPKKARFTLPPNTVVGLEDLSGGKFFQDFKYAYQNKANPNLMTAQFMEGQKIKIQLEDGTSTIVEANELAEAVDLANKKYLEYRREQIKEQEFETVNEPVVAANDEKVSTKKKEKDIEEEM